MLLFANVFTAEHIRFVTAQPALLSYLPILFRTAFSLELEQNMTPSGSKTVFSLTDSCSVRKVLDAFGLNPDRNPGTGINRAVLDEEGCHTAFLKGIFLAGGCVADPAVRYHLELVTPRFNLCQELISFLGEMELEPKCTMRRSNYVLYYKDSETIENFLTQLGSPIYAMKVMNAKVEKFMRNQVNRVVNCDTANINKTVNAALPQIHAISVLRKSGRFDKLPQSLKETAVLREENPDLSLAQLSELFSPPILRTTLNYRLKKLISLAENPAEDQ